MAKINMLAKKIKEEKDEVKKAELKLELYKLMLQGLK